MGGRVRRRGIFPIAGGYSTAPDGCSGGNSPARGVQYTGAEDFMIALKHILVATDFGDAAANALAYGRELARRFDAKLHVLHVVDDLAARMVTGTGLLYNPGATEAAL